MNSRTAQAAFGVALLVAIATVIVRQAVAPSYPAALYWVTVILGAVAGAALELAFRAVP